MADACGRDDDLAALFYTGGTTGRSKGVMLSHRSLISSFLCSSATVPSPPDAIFLHSPPMFHLADPQDRTSQALLAGRGPPHPLTGRPGQGDADVIVVGGFASAICADRLSRDG